MPLANNTSRRHSEIPDARNHGLRLAREPLPPTLSTAAELPSFCFHDFHRALVLPGRDRCFYGGGGLSLGATTGNAFLLHSLASRRSAGKRTPGYGCGR